MTFFFSLNKGTLSYKRLPRSTYHFPSIFSNCHFKWAFFRLPYLFYFIFLKYRNIFILINIQIIDILNLTWFNFPFRTFLLIMIKNHAPNGGPCVLWNRNFEVLNQFWLTLWMRLTVSRLVVTFNHYPCLCSYISPPISTWCTSTLTHKTLEVTTRARSVCRLREPHLD